MLERERLIEIVVAVAAVALMLGAMVWIGTTHGGEGGALTDEGGEMLVGAIVGFILLLTLVGIGLAFALNDPPEADDADARSAT